MRRGTHAVCIVTRIQFESLLLIQKDRRVRESFIPFVPSQVRGHAVAILWFSTHPPLHSLFRKYFFSCIKLCTQLLSALPISLVQNVQFPFVFLVIPPPSSPPHPNSTILSRLKADPDFCAPYVRALSLGSSCLLASHSAPSCSVALPSGVSIPSHFLILHLENGHRLRLRVVRGQRHEQQEIRAAIRDSAQHFLAGLLSPMKDVTASAPGFVVCVCV